MSGKKDSQTIDKPAMEFMVGDFLLEMGKVLKYGAVKYGDENWKQFPLSEKDYKGARLRHAFKDGADDDTGYDHLVHEAVNCMFEYWHKYIKVVDDVKCSGNKCSAKKPDLTKEYKIHDNDNPWCICNKHDSVHKHSNIDDVVIVRGSNTFKKNAD